MSKKVKTTSSFMMGIIFTTCGILLGILSVGLIEQFAISYNPVYESYQQINLLEKPTFDSKREEFQDFLRAQMANHRIIKEEFDFDEFYFNKIETLVHDLHVELDTKKHTDLGTGVYIRETPQSKEDEDKGNHIFKKGNKSLQVIGTFKSSKDTNRVYIPFDLSFKEGLLGTISGSYLLDGFNENVRSEWESYAKSNDLNIEFIPTNFIDSVAHYVQEYSPVIVGVILCVFLISLNAISAIMHWMIMREEELTIRLLLGSTVKRLRKQINYEFLIILLKNYLLSQSIVFLIFYFNSKTINVSLLSLSISGIILLINGIIILNLALTFFLKKGMQARLGDMDA